MKKLVVTLLVVGLLIGAGGCTTFIITAPSVILTTALIAPDLDAPVEYEGGAWYVDPNNPNHKMRWMDF